MTKCGVLSLSYIPSERIHSIARAIGHDARRGQRSDRKRCYALLPCTAFPMLSLSPRRFGANALFLSPLLAASLLWPRAAHAAPAPSYHLAATWKLPGEGGWDYLTDDAATHRLYIARGSKIQVLDTQTGALVGAVSGLEGAHGVALAPPTQTRLRDVGPHQQRCRFRPQNPATGWQARHRGNAARRHHF